MSKLLVAKLILMVAALGAMTLLQGCSKEVDAAVITAAWTPVGSVTTAAAASQGVPASGGGGSQAAGGVVQ
jgi:hypothetical protein